MEAEYSDLFDRQMMALYGAMPGQPTKVHMATDLTSKARANRGDKEFVETVFQTEGKTTRRNFGRNGGLLGNLDLDNLDINFLTKNTGFTTTKKAPYFTRLNPYDSDGEKNSENAGESQ